MPLDIDQVRIDVALGRRVMVLGDLLLPPDPSPSSLATCRDIAQKLDEWQGPGVVVICGQLVATPNGGTPGSAAASLAGARRSHRRVRAPSPPVLIRRCIMVVGDGAPSAATWSPFSTDSASRSKPLSTCTA